MGATNRYMALVHEWQKSGVAFGDFMLGQPRDPPKPEFLSALKTSLENGSVKDTPTDYFGYSFYQGEAQNEVVQMVKKHRNVDVEPHDCTVTNGALGALMVTLQVLTDPGDEVIIIAPAYHCYPGMCELIGTKIVLVPSDPESFDLDLAAISKAISNKTKAIIINSPNNPTGKIYSKETLEGLGKLLEDHSLGRDAPIMLISDEAYCRIVFDGTFAPSPLNYYNSSIMIYTFGKATLAPGERLGYLALSPKMSISDRVALRESISRACTTGWSRPSSLAGHALKNMDSVLIDIGQLEARRDKLFNGLSEMGYDVTKPQGTFYMMLKCPRGLNGSQFTKELEQEKVLVFSGEHCKMPSHVRLSLTCSDQMIDFALPVFKRLLRKE